MHQTSTLVKKRNFILSIEQDFIYLSFVRDTIDFLVRETLLRIRLSLTVSYKKKSIHCSLTLS